MTYLCVSIFVTDAAATRRDIALAAEQGADIVELRIDQFNDAEAVGRIVRESTLPCILTCRSADEGGQCHLPDPARIALLDEATRLSNLDGTYIDVELQTLRRAPVSIARQLIASTHDFAGRPRRLYSLIEELNESSANIGKIAWMARSIRDNLDAFEILQHRQKPTIALCMGEAGLISRVLARKFGAFLTFASLRADGGTASGQIPIADMKGLYRWDSIGPDTKVYGVVAQPVAHSMSPAIHNAAFSAIHYNGIYLPLLVQGSYESFKAFMETFVPYPGLDLSGLSITIPHKENALRYLREKGADIEPLAERIGAVNTILIEREGNQVVLRGRNTDYAAILDSITAAMGIGREDLSRQRVAVLGAGGTGRTAVAALAHYGATVVIYNRTKDRADVLAAEFNGRPGKVVSAALEDLPGSQCNVYINTTSVGMHPNLDASPIDGIEPKLARQTLVFDAVYNPPKTKLLRQAQAAGAKTISGVEMFVRQAATQFEAWTHHPAPDDVMRQVIESRLARL